MSLYTPANWHLNGEISRGGGDYVGTSQTLTPSGCSGGILRELRINKCLQSPRNRSNAVKKNGPKWRDKLKFIQKTSTSSHCSWRWFYTLPNYRMYFFLFSSHMVSEYWFTFWKKNDYIKSFFCCHIRIFACLSKKLVKTTQLLFRPW